MRVILPPNPIVLVGFFFLEFVEKPPWDAGEGQEWDGKFGTGVGGAKHDLFSQIPKSHKAFWSFLRIWEKTFLGWRGKGWEWDGEFWDEEQGELRVILSPNPVGLVGFLGNLGENFPEMEREGSGVG